MKRYVGAAINAYVGIALLLFVVGSLFCAVALVTMESADAGSVLCAFICLLAVIFWGLYARQCALQLYAWISLNQSSVRVKALLTKPFVIWYKDCKCIRIGYYTHGIANSSIGSKVYYIILSHSVLNERDLACINLWKPSKSGIKIGFNKKTYNYLLSVLPEKQRQLLFQDYCTLFQKKKLHNN